MSLQGKVVILAEKPKQAKAYVEAYKVKQQYPTHIEIEACDTFPNGATVTWAIGHLLELWSPADYDEKWKKWDRDLLPIIPSEFRYKVSDSKKAQFNAVKKLFNEADTIICGTDIDREGSAIFHLIFRHTGAKNKVLKRLWINSLEIPAIREGFNNLRDIEKDLLMFEEANARQMADWLVGMNASRLYGSKLAEKGISIPISVGRVQSVLCWIIYARQLEIENFKPSDFFEIEADFATTTGGMYKGRISGRFDDKNALIAMLNNEGVIVGERANGVIESVETKRKSSKPPKLHSLSTLQVKANRLWKLNPSEVLAVVQGLYEKKIVSYPRSDCQYITNSEFEYLVRNLDKYREVIGTTVPIKNTTANKHFVDGKKVEEHYAIVPTKTIPSKEVLNSLSSDEKTIYTEIVRSTLAMFCGEYIYDETLIETAINDVLFETVGKTEVDIGFKALWANEKDVDEVDEKSDKEAEQKLPLVNEDDAVEGIVRIKEGVTSPPKVFTEGQLIQVMKTCGSGKYIEIEESDSDILKSVEGIGTEATRASIIERIKAQQYIEIKRNSVHITPKGRIHCEALRGTMLSSPAITAQWESYLRTIGEGKGRKEEFMRNIIKFVNHLIDTVDDTFESPQVLSAIQMQVEQSVLGICPACKKGKIIDKQAIYGCSEYTNGCKFTLPKKLCKKTLTTTQIQALLSKGETGLIKGFESGKQKKFDAKLKLNKAKDFEIEFVFPKRRTRK